MYTLLVIPKGPLQLEGSRTESSMATGMISFGSLWPTI